MTDRINGIEVRGASDNERLRLMSIAERGGRVFIEFAQPASNIDLEPDTARQVAEVLARCAYIATYGREPDGAPRSMITDALRARLVARAKLVARSLAERDKPWDYIAQEITDLLLTELA